MATEQEFKFFLTRDQMAGLERRVRREREPEERLQVNYYYDTEDGLLRRREITLRARLTETYLELQYKRRLPQEGGFRRHEEWSRPLGQTLPGKLRLCAEADGRGREGPMRAAGGSGHPAEALPVFRRIAAGFGHQPVPGRV